MPEQRSRPAVLLLGDSRDRLLYQDVALRACTGHNASAHRVLWWVEPFNANRSSDAADGYSTKHQVEMKGGTICTPSSQWSAVGYFGHYGVAADGRYIGAAYTSHGHHDWQGPGWTDAIVGGRPQVNSPVLAAEAVRRFVAAFGRSAPVVVVLSSMLWDLARRCLNEPNQQLSDWRAGFHANYTALARAVGALIVGHPENRLLLTTGYFPAPRWYCMDRITPAFILESARVVRETALSLRHTITAIRLVDLQKIFLNRSGTGGWQSESASHLLRDDRHA